VHREFVKPFKPQLLMYLAHELRAHVALADLQVGLLPVCHGVFRYQYDVPEEFLMLQFVVYISVARYTVAGAAMLSADGLLRKLIRRVQAAVQQVHNAGFLHGNLTGRHILVNLERQHRRPAVLVSFDLASPDELQRRHRADDEPDEVEKVRLFLDVRTKPWNWAFVRWQL
jgi:hypothetical protein